MSNRSHTGRGHIIDVTDQRFGRLVVVARSHTSKSGVVWSCVCDCGNTTLATGTDLRRGTKKSCGCYSLEVRKRRGKDSPNIGRVGPSSAAWTGGRKVDRDGYITVSIKHLFPDVAVMYGPKKYRLHEHTAVMARYLGRPIRKDESVHHKNGLRDDNRIENLELWCNARHRSGQRVTDIIAWAKEILARYEHEPLS